MKRKLEVGGNVVNILKVGNNLLLLKLRNESGALLVDISKMAIL